MNKRKTIGLVLSGGAARGFAHLGVLQAMEEMNLKPDFISGASAGSIAAAFYADGYTPKDTMKILQLYKLTKFFKPGWAGAGLMKTTGLFRILYENLWTENIEDLPIKTWLCITNLNKGKAEYHNSGSLARKVLASASIPVFFKPVYINNQLMVDGGVCDNLPIEPLKNIADVIIGVNVNPIHEVKVKPTINSIAKRTFLLSINSHQKNLRLQPDIMIEPSELSAFGYFDLKQAEKIFDIGYICACKTLQNNSLLKACSKDT